MSSLPPHWLHALDSTRIHKRAETTQSEIDRAETVLNCRFPADYREFLLATDGCDVTFGNVPDVIISPLWSPLEDDLAVVKDSEHAQDVTWPVKIIRQNTQSEQQQHGNSAADSGADDRSNAPVKSDVSFLHIGTDDAQQHLVFLRRDLSTRRDACPVYCFIPEELECVECAASFRALIGFLSELRVDQCFSPVYADSVTRPRATSARRPWWQFWM